MRPADYALVRAVAGGLEPPTTLPADPLELVAGNELHKLELLVREARTALVEESEADFREAVAGAVGVSLGLMALVASW